MLLNLQLRHLFLRLSKLLLLKLLQIGRHRAVFPNQDYYTATLPALKVAHPPVLEPLRIVRVCRALRSRDV